MAVEPEKNHSYIFGDYLGKAMSKVDIQTQFEASLMSMTLMMIGLVITGFYLVFYTEFALWYKIFLVINLLAGLVFFWSNLITQFQMYQNYMKVKQYNEDKLPVNKQLKGGLN